MRYTNPDIESSYRENDLGRTLYDIVLEKRPAKIVEFGILHGYSIVAMAMALDELKEGHITAYDLFEKYPYKHGTKDAVQKELQKYGVEKYVTLAESNLDEWLKKPEPFDLLHVDVSNEGDVIKRLHEGTKDAVQNGAMVLFEGGSPERDFVDWMVKYHKPKMNESGVAYRVVNSAFPSISMLL